MRTVDRFKHALWLHHLQLDVASKQLADGAVAQASWEDLGFEWFQKRGYILTVEWRGGDNEVKLYAPTDMTLGLSRRVSIALRGKSLLNIVRQAASMLYIVQELAMPFSVGADCRFHQVL